LLNGINILIAEDNKLNQKIVYYILHKQNAKVTLASNGKEAIDLLLNNPYDILLLDLHMPVMDGYSAARSIRTELKNSIPIIALTASISDEDNGTCLQTGMNACISKPFDSDDLCKLILRLTKNNQ
jgi:CheY-like chemotaxis protein